MLKNIFNQQKAWSVLFARNLYAIIEADGGSNGQKGIRSKESELSLS